MRAGAAVLNAAMRTLDTVENRGYLSNSEGEPAIGRPSCPAAGEPAELRHERAHALGVDRLAPPSHASGSSDSLRRHHPSGVGRKD